MTKKEPLTLNGKTKIQNELDELVKNDREEIKIKIQEARELGDLKENAEYHAAKEKQAHIEGRILQLQGILSNCEVIEINPSNKPSNIMMFLFLLFFIFSWDIPHCCIENDFHTSLNMELYENIPLVTITELVFSEIFNLN